jgi:hypothetical protein
MLECEPAELEGRGDTALAAHLGTCAACRRRAGILVSELRALDSALAALAAGSVREEAAEVSERRLPAAAGGRIPTDAPGARGLAAGVSGSARWQRMWRLAAPLAAAAAVAALVLAWPGNGSAPGRRAERPAATAGVSTRSRAPDVGEPMGTRAAAGAARAPELRVRVPADARVAVFQTRDPSVAVVWFFPTENGG